MNVYKYILCTSGGLLTSIITYNVLLYRDQNNDHKFYDLHSVYCNIEYNLLEKFIGTILHRPKRKMRQNPIKQYGDVKLIVGISPTMV